MNDLAILAKATRARKHSAETAKSHVSQEASIEVIHYRIKAIRSLGMRPPLDDLSVTEYHLLCAILSLATWIRKPTTREVRGSQKTAAGLKKATTGCQDANAQELLRSRDSGDISES